MLIVITRDQDIMTWVNSSTSGASNWTRTKQLSAGTQSEANSQMDQLLKLVKSDEPLCITGHGNDSEVGDEGSKRADWTWTVAEMATHLAGLVSGYKGPILMEVCSDSMTSFAAELALALEKMKKLKGVWIYGYIKAVSVTHTFPSPATLDKNVELSGHLVS